MLAVYASPPPSPVVDARLATGLRAADFPDRTFTGKSTSAFHGALRCSPDPNYNERKRDRGQNVTIADDYDIAWDPHERSDDSLTLWTSKVTLSPKFFTEMTTSPVPIDLRALKALKRSPMRLDIYSWLTWRMFAVKRPTQIPWEYLKAQFGSGYADDAHGLRNFRQAFVEALNAVMLFYSEANVGFDERALTLRPSPTHVPELR